MKLSQPTSVDTSFEQTRHRLTQRLVSVFDNLDHISDDWVGLKRIVQVERLGTRAGKPYEETVYYISSIALEASDFAQGIRGHWGVENRLHWGGSAVGGFPDLRRLPFKDVVFNEDKAQMVDGYASANFSILRSFVINLFRHNGFDSLTRAIRHCAHNILLLFSFLE